MLVIPVLDLVAGQVVRARRGERASYRPVRSALASSAEPEAVVAAFLGVHPFPIIYVADLDAIVHSQPQERVLDRLRRQFPHLRFWVDGGFNTVQAGMAYASHTGSIAVLGSETLTCQGPDGSAAFSVLRRREDLALSLDFRRGAALGDAALQDRPQCWPRYVLAMNLDKVGAGEGPDTALISRLASQAAHANPAREREDLGTASPAAGAVSSPQVLAAGGIRHAQDIHAVRKAGGSGALVASALHDGVLSGADLKLLESTEPQPGQTA